MRHSVVVLTTTLLLAACAANGHHQFYTNLLTGQSIESFPNLVPYMGNPEVYRSDDPPNDGLAMLENGFELIGYSHFDGPLNDPVPQARLVHAAVVLVYGKFSHSIAGTIPYTVTTPGTYITSTSEGSIYGTDGLSTYSGTTSTYVPGTSSRYETTYQIDRYEQSASFWVKTRPDRLGIVTRDLNPAERQRYQRNRGVLARAIIKNSPAFLADLLRGDVIVRIGDDDVIDVSSYRQLLGRYQGREVSITYRRAGTEVTKTVKLNSAN